MPCWRSLQHPCALPRLRRASAPPAVAIHRGDSTVGNRTSVTLGRAAMGCPSLEAQPLPFGTFEITYCCYFFSLLTLGQRSPRPCPPSVLPGGPGHAH